MARRDSAEPVGAFHNSANLNLAKRRLCAALGISQGVPNIAARFPSPVSVLHAPPPSADRTAPWPDAPISAQQKAAPHFHDPPPDGPIRLIELRPPIAALSWLAQLW